MTLTRARHWAEGGFHVHLSGGTFSPDTCEVCAEIAEAREELALAETVITAIGSTGIRHAQNCQWWGTGKCGCGALAAIVALNRLHAFVGDTTRPPT